MNSQTHEHKHIYMSTFEHAHQGMPIYAHHSGLFHGMINFKVLAKSLNHCWWCFSQIF